MVTELKVLQGAEQIGGNIILIKGNKSRIFLDFGIRSEIFLDEGVRLTNRTADVFGQTEVADPINDAEIDRLRVATHLACDLGFLDAEDLCRRRRVNIFARIKGVHKPFTSRKGG